MILNLHTALKQDRACFPVENSSSPAGKTLAPALAVTQLKLSGAVHAEVPLGSISITMGRGQGAAEARGGRGWSVLLILSTVFYYMSFTRVASTCLVCVRVTCKRYQIPRKPGHVPHIRRRLLSTGSFGRFNVLGVAWSRCQNPKHIIAPNEKRPPQRFVLLFCVGSHTQLRLPAVVARVVPKHFSSSCRPQEDRLQPQKTITWFHTQPPSQRSEE